MTNVYLYGELRNKFGDEFNFNINSAKEAFLAINANRKGFLDEVKKLAIKGVHYRIIVDDNIVENTKEIDIKKSPKEIHVVPIVWGAGGNTGKGLLMIAAAAALATVAGPTAWMAMMDMGFSVAGATAVQTTMYAVAAAIAVQGVMTILYPPTKPDFNQEVQAGGKSYLFGNKSNNTSQGQAVPVGYGRLKIGSSQISAGIDHYALNTDIKQLMTPVDKPTNDYIELIAENEQESAGVVTDYFSTEQSADLEDTVTYCSVNVLNSYVDIVSNSAAKIISNPVEVVVTRNGEVISNPDLTTYDDNVTYEWEEISNDSSKGKVFIENPYTMKNGLIVRSYHTPDFKIQSEFANVKSSQSAYFQRYNAGDLVKFGPTQFANLKFANWDAGYQYFSGEVVYYPTGNPAIDAYFQAKVIAGGTNTGFYNLTPTGDGNTIRSDYWRKIIAPNLEYLYKCVTNVSGHLPTTGELNGGAPVAESTFWTRVESPSTTAQMNTLFNDYPAYENTKQYIHVGEVKALNEQGINGTVANVDNYGMEFLGYFYVPTEGSDGKTFIKDVYDLGTSTGLYEIIRIGDTGQWSGIGFTGLNGVALTPRVGATFHKNSTQGNGNGKVMLVGAYQFKLDSDDASDLYIDSNLASAYYSGHGMFSGFANPTSPTNAEINALNSSTTTLYLTAGYHRLLARVQDLRGSEGISIYYKYDTNRDGVFSDWQLVPKDKLVYSPSDLNIPKTQKLSDVGKTIISTANIVPGDEYKIYSLGSVNWTSIGSAIGNTQTVFVPTSSPAGGEVTDDFVTYAEQKSADSNRIVRFVSERPEINGVKSAGYSFYKARYRCKVNINNKQTLYSAPVKVNIQFLSTTTTFRGIGEPILSQNVQTA